MYDSEGSFIISIFKRKGFRLGWEIQADLAINLNVKDENLLHLIMSYFGVGTLRYNKIHRSVIYSVKDLKSLTNIIIPFFDKYHLVTQKRADFELFKQVVEKMNRKEDITRDGLL